MEAPSRSVRFSVPLLGGLLIVAGLLGCDTPTSIFELNRSEPSFGFLDGTQASGNPHFFFLPPLVPTPNASGTFDPMAEPLVRICEWTGGACVTEIAVFTMSSGPGSETVRVVEVDEHYIVNWHTDEFSLESTKVYRVSVVVSGQELGYADVVVVSSGNELKNLDTGDLIALKDGRTLPIKFRIEEGAAGIILRTVDTGQFHTCGLKADGSAFCWGGNTFGQLGTGTAISTNMPAPVAGGLTFAALSTANQHTCGVTPDGIAYCWGDNSVGALGTATTVETCVQNAPCAKVPWAVSGGHTFTAISAKSYHTCGIATDNLTYCWGFNSFGELGNGSTGGSTATPTPVSGGHVFTSVSSGDRHTCGLTAAGAAYCWGFGYYGVLGDGSTSDSSIPVPVSGGLVFASLASTSSGHACGLLGDGTAYCWGRNDFGQLGIGGTTGTFAPAPVSGGLEFTRVVVSSSYSCGLASLGTAHCWGWNQFGQLGDGTGADRYAPTLVVGGLPLTFIAAGTSLHTCGLTEGGTTYCWGRGVDGQLGNGVTSDSNVPVKVNRPL